MNPAEPAPASAELAAGAADVPALRGKPARDAQRRAQIIEAARACVLAQGFHAAPIAAIARAAGMSVGQLYRYFDGKDAIVRTIVEQIAERRVQHMRLGGAVPWAPARLARRSPAADALADEDARLMVEIAAEASRNPEIAAIVREADRRSQQQLAARLCEARPGLADDDAQALAEAIATLLEGSACRRQLAPPVQAEALQRLYARWLGELGADRG